MRSRIEMMRGYAETTDCRRRLLLGYFGEQVVDPCGHCDNCEAGTARAADPAGDAAAAEEGLESRSTVRHPEWGDGVVMSTEPDRVTVLFAEHGYKTLSLDAVRENYLLEPSAGPARCYRGRRRGAALREAAAARQRRGLLVVFGSRGLSGVGVVVSEVDIAGDVGVRAFWSGTRCG